MPADTTAAHTLDEVDEETLQALLLHLGHDGTGPAGSAVSPAGATAPAHGDGSSQGDGGTATASTVAGQAPDAAAAHPPVRPASTAALHTATDDIPDYALPDAQYVERMVLPLLLRGLEEVAAARPPDPLAFLGAYLIANNPQQPVHKTTAASVLAAAGASPEAAESAQGEPAASGTSAAGGSPPQRESPFLPSDQPAIAEAVHRAMSRVAPQPKAAPQGTSAV